MSRIRARLAIAAAGAVLAIVAVAALPQVPQQPPQFKSGVDLVTIDLSAMTADGTPIRDLRAEEIRISVGGKPRTVKSFEFVEVAPVRVPSKASPPPAPAPAPIPASTTAGSTAGRNVFVVVLHEHIRPGNERIAMEGVRRLIDQLEPRDRVAIVTMPFGRVEVDLTTDHEAAKKRLHQIVGHADVTIAVPTGTTTTSEAIDLLAFLKSITPLAGAKTVLLISEGFQTGESPFDETNPTGASLLDRPETTAVAPLLNDMATLRGEVTDLRTAAAVARAQFYVIQPNNFATDPAFKARGQERVDLKSLDNDRYTTMASQTRALAGLATMVGGRFLQLSGKSEPVFDRIVRETSGYYALAFETEPEDRNDKARTVDVSTTRKGVTLRARRTFLNVTTGGPKGTARVSVQSLLGDGVSHTDLPLAAVAFVTRAPGGEVRVTALAQSLGPELQEAGFVLVNAKNTAAASWPADLSTGTAPIVSAKVVAPGHYRLRAAAIDANGTGGAVDYEFDASLATVGSFQASSLMTGVQVGTSFKPRLSFTPADDLVPYFEVYGTGDIEVAFELTPAGGGAAVVTAPGALTATRDADRRIVSATLPLGSVPSGSYVLRAVVRTGGTPIGTLAANLTITP